MPPPIGKFALRMTLPLLDELLRMIADREEPRPLAVIVPLIRMVGCDHGRTITRPSRSEIAREL